MSNALISTQKQTKSLSAVPVTWLGHVKPLPAIKLTIDGKDFKWVLDTGCSHSAVRDRQVNVLRWKRTGLSTRCITYATSSNKETVAIVRPEYNEDLLNFPTELKVPPKTTLLPFNSTGVLGNDFIAANRVVRLNWKEGELFTREIECSDLSKFELLLPYKALPFIRLIVQDSKSGRCKEVLGLIDTGSVVSVMLPDLSTFLHCGSESELSDAGCVLLPQAGPNQVTAGGSVAVSLVFQTNTSETVLQLGVPFEIASLSAIKHHQRRLREPVILLGLSFLLLRKSLVISHTEKAVWF